MAKKNKLFPSKWTLFWKRVKYLFHTKRWVPWIARKTCKNCSFVYNTDLYKICPACDHGDGVVWVVTVQGKIDGVFDSKEKAKFCADNIKMESGIIAIVEHHRIW